MQDLQWLLLLLLGLIAILYFFLNKKTGKANRPFFSPDYYKGLNYLLNEQPDKALEVFIQLVEVDHDTIETHLAIGGLFRRRGEVERAIRIHQNLIARPSLDQDQRALALLELGKDYMHAGLLDRAEGLFKELVKQKAQLHEALNNLLEVYQRENEWASAVETARMLEKTSSDRLEHVIAHYYCEMAENYSRSGEFHKAHTALNHALESDNLCVRANILLGDHAYANAKYKQALKYYTRIFQQDDEFIPEVIERISKCIEQGIPSHEFNNYLEWMHGKDNLSSAVPGLTRYIKEIEGSDSAFDYIEKQLQANPTLLGLKEWLDLSDIKNEVQSQKLNALETGLDRMIAQESKYQCRHCGYSSRLLYWQCPSCKSWGSVKPTTVILSENDWIEKV